MENRGAVWSNVTYVRQTAEGEANIIHEVHLGDGVMSAPSTGQLNPEQHQQVIQAIAQNPTIASCFKMAVSRSGGTEDPVHVTLPGHEYSLQVPKDDWSASSQTSRTTMAKGIPATSQAYTPVQPTSSLPAAIPSVSAGDTSAIGPPPGFLILPEDPIKHQAVLREQIRADGKTLGKASQVLCNNFHHMGKFHSKQMKAMQECQLVDVCDLKAQVTQAVSDWRVDLSSCQHLLGMVPSTSLYNSVVANLRTKTYQMANKVKQAEVAYAESKKGTLKALEKLKKETLDKLETLSDSAIDRFMDEMATAVYEHFGTSLEAVPFMASAARIVANFHLITFALALQSADLPLDAKVGLSQVELDLSTTLAHVIPSLCPLGATTTLPRLDQLQGDLVGAEEVLAPDNVETDREKAVSSTSNEGAARVSQVPSTFSKSRSATPAFSHEASPSPAKAQVATKGATMTNTFCSNATTRTIPQYMPPLLSGHRDAEELKHLQDIFRQHTAPSATGSAPSAPILGMASTLVHKGPPLRDRRCPSLPVLEIPKLDKWLKPWWPVQVTNWHPAALFIKCMMLQHRMTLRSFKNPMRTSM